MTTCIQNPTEQSTSCNTHACKINTRGAEAERLLSLSLSCNIMSAQPAWDTQQYPVSTQPMTQYFENQLQQAYEKQNQFTKMSNIFLNSRVILSLEYVWLI